MASRQSKNPSGYEDQNIKVYTEVISYIIEYWPKIIAESHADDGTTIGLPNRYIVPAVGEVLKAFFYWDSYFHAVGVDGTTHEALAVDIAENMLYLIDRFGMIPNGNKFYFLSRSQPPLSTATFRRAFAIKSRLGHADARSFLERALVLSEKEHEVVWLAETFPNMRRVHRGLSRYFDLNYVDELAQFESGWDRTTRCDGRWLDHLPVCLNAILYAREIDMSWMAEQLGYDDHASKWRSAAQQRARTMNSLMWDEDTGFYYDYDYRADQRNETPSAAGFFPLWAALATPRQAQRIVEQWLPKFECHGGVVTTLEPRTAHQWAWPNGWAPINWLVVKGLENYGYQVEAERIMRRWCNSCATTFRTQKVMLEKYNVVDIGAPPVEDRYGSVEGFGWSNAVFLDFARRLGIPG